MTISRFFSLPSHRETWRLALPIILSNSSVPMLGAVDTAVVGHLPDPHYIGSVAIGAMIFSFLYWGFGFLRMGTTGFVAQAAGQDDATEVRSVLARALLLSVHHTHDNGTTVSSAPTMIVVGHLTASSVAR